MFRRFSIPAALLLILGISVHSCKQNNAAKPVAADEEKDSLIQQVFHPNAIDSPAIAQFLVQYPLFGHHREELFTFYKNRKQQSAWFNTYGLVEQAGLFMNQLDHFSDEGMHDTILYYTQLKEIYATIADPHFSYAESNSIISQCELLLTAEFFVYAQKVWFGLSEKKTNELDWYIQRKTIPSVSILDSVLSGGKNAFMTFEPAFPQYALLKEKLKKYKALAENEFWDSIYIPAGMKSIKPGDSAAVLTEIRHRLFVLGYLDEADSVHTYTDDLLTGVKKFQTACGIDTDGAMGNQFFREINCTLQKRVRQIELNMERCRWIPSVPQGTYVLVNIPEYKLHIFNNGAEEWNMNVVVGKASTGTAIFNDELEYIVFSPYWIPPPSILNNEILPALKKDAGYLNKENMEAFDTKTGKVIDVSKVDWKKYTKMPFSIRQRPGDNNALGHVKFLFPNQYSIYLHDTPSRNLFSRSQRNFSHGCIRLQEPRRFAEYLLRNDSTFTPQKIDSLYTGGKETFVRLQEKLPVYIVYFTAWVDVNGEINFRRDIYGHDAKLEKTLYDASE